MTIDEHLKKLVEHIEQTSLTEDEKYDLYELIRTSFREVTYPILVKYMPKEKLVNLATHAETATMDDYIELIKESITSQEAAPHLERVMHGILNEIEQSLIETKSIKSEVRLPI